MKKVSVLILLVIILVSCSQESIIGKWSLENLESDVPDMVITEEAIIIMDIPIPYEIEGDTIYINDMEGRKSFKYKIKGDTLTFVQGDVTETYIRFKE
ncbi:hypothetical protein EZV73_04920 [Acidaminobacter sp. JC074]|uniref:hypothetical protein n=1 Tax=Acidaminobacter sp. JC074 TaxID=2530199 RepID=UPI001F112AE8|nr:hypothetical protein [Acidaminobacter sp. JC074]MCH4886896.1 hypothetical protein [Acidaminobacter sp. JC074]